MIKRGAYTIKRRDSRNIEVTKAVTKTISSQMIADKMNESDFGVLEEGHGYEIWNTGDEYEAEEFVGYFGNTEKAMIKILDDGIIDMWANEAAGLLKMIRHIAEAKQEIIEACKGVEL